MKRLINLIKRYFWPSKSTNICCESIKPEPAKVEKTKKQLQLNREELYGA